MIDDLIEDAIRRMDKSAENAQHEFNTIRTGRASAALLDRIDIDYYGQKTPLKQLATINVPDPRTLTIQPFDPGSLKSIERAIQESELGLTPANDGKIIRLPIPQLTEERRKELVKVVRHLAEESRVAVRNVRRDVLHRLKELAHSGEVGDDDERRKELVKVVRHLAEESRVAVRNVRRDVLHHLKGLAHSGEVGDDDERRAEERVQKLTDEHVAKIDDLLKRKEAEIMEV